MVKLRFVEPVSRVQFSLVTPMEVKSNDDEYYRALQAALMSYDQSLWAIPAVFFTVTGLVFSFYDKTEVGALRLIFLIFVILFLLILVFQFYKTHFFNISIQKRINEFDRFYAQQNGSSLKRFPLASMTDNEIIHRICELQTDKNDPTVITSFQLFIIQNRMTTFVKRCMWLVVTCFVSLWLFEFLKFMDGTFSILQ